MEPGHQQTAKSDNGDGAAECQSEHDEDISQGEHHELQLPNRLDLKGRGVQGERPGMGSEDRG